MFFHFLDGDVFWNTHIANFDDVQFTFCCLCFYSIFNLLKIPCYLFLEGTTSLCPVVFVISSVLLIATLHACVLSLQSGPTLCDPMGCSLPCSSVHGFIPAKILEWVAFSFSRGSSPPRDRTHVSCRSFIGRCILYHWATWEASCNPRILLNMFLKPLYFYRLIIRSRGLIRFGFKVLIEIFHRWYCMHHKHLIFIWYEEEYSDWLSFFDIKINHRVLFLLAWPKHLKLPNSLYLMFYQL